MVFTGHLDCLAEAVDFPCDILRRVCHHRGNIPLLRYTEGAEGRMVQLDACRNLRCVHLLRGTSCALGLNGNAAVRQCNHIPVIRTPLSIMTVHAVFAFAAV